MGGISKRLSAVSKILNKKKKNGKNKALTLDCSSESTTESLLAQLEAAQHDSITHLTLNDSLQRRDNVSLFNALSAFVNCKSCQLRQIRLVEPRIKAENYRRWCFKKTNFLRHVYQDCHDKDIEVKIQGTLILETPEDKPQDVSSWLMVHFPKTIPQDRDIRSIWVSLRDVKPTGAVEETKSKRRGQPRSDVERVFQGLIDVFNNDNRYWDFVHCHIVYTAVPKYAAPQTEALMEVAQLYDIPLQVQWEPLDDSKKERGTWTRTSRQAAERVPAMAHKSKMLPTNPPRDGTGGKVISAEDTTASTAEYEGSSGALLGY